jgi:uncharacterized protein
MIFILSIHFVKAQDSAVNADIFQKISAELQSFKIDTSAAPEDKTTSLIRKLRELKGVFNINEAIAFKLAEEESENETSKEELDKVRRSMLHGEAKKWLDNAVINIYRQHFSHKELKQLIKFYKSSAGQKMASQFPFIMMKSLMAAQTIHDWVIKS